MAATNPFRVSDLIAKYGWKIMPYLSNLGPTLLAEAQVLFVDSGHTNALDADDTEHGHSFEKPLKTWDYALDLCTAGERSVIFLAPGHNDELGNAQIDNDVSDITIIGIGEGTNRPRVDYDHANSSVLIGADNIHIINVVFMPAIGDIVIGVEIEAGKKGTIFERCHFAEGENATDEFILGVDVKAGCDNTKFINCTGRTKALSAGALAAVKFTGASDNCIVEKCRFIGNYGTAAIVNDTAACTDLLIDDLTCKVQDGEPGIEVHTDCTGIIRNVAIESTGLAVDSMIVAAKMSWFNAYGVTTDGKAGVIIGGGEAQAALNTVPSSITIGSLWDILDDGIGGGYDKSTDSLEALRTRIDLIGAPSDVTDIVPASPTAGSLQDALNVGSNTYLKATDSLEAIANAILTGTNILAGVNLDHFMKVAVVAEQDMSAEITTGSALAHILVKAAAGNVNDFDPTTDSLEAIADAVTGFTTAVSTIPIPRSVQDILEKDGGGTFDAQYDSLEAIADRLIDANIDLLTSAADGGGNVYPDSVVQESIIAFILSADANPNKTTYNNTTDSLEAIRNRIDSLNTADQIDIDAILVDTNSTIPGTITTMQGNVTDILLDTETTIPGTITTLQSDATAILADTITISGGTLPADPTSGSLARYIASGGTSLGQPLPSDMSLIDIIGDFTGAYNATDPDDNIKACLAKISKYIVDGDGDYATGTSLPSDKSIVQVIGAFDGTGSGQAGSAKASLDLAHIDLDAIIVDQVYVERCIEKVATSTDDILFNVTGEVIITSLVGIVTTTAIGGVQNRIKIGLDATDTVDHDFSTEVDTNADVVGTRYVFSAANPAVLTPLANGAVGSGQPMWPWICRAGDIIQSKNGGDAGTTGQINWYLTYRPLSSDGAVVTA